MLDNCPQRCTIASHSPVQTEWLARAIADHCGSKDTLLLFGGIGSGKTVFARGFIQHMLTGCGAWEEVPSPTYTLVQTYQAGETSILHADLYRLKTPDEALELGLDEAFGRAVCLVEWPDRLGIRRPTDCHCLTFEFDQSDDSIRRVMIATYNQELADYLAALDGRVPS